MAIVSRLQLNHPALGTAGGASLHASIEDLYEKIGDNMNDRWFAISDFDDTETVDLLHNFETDFGNINYDIWQYTGSEWVLLTEQTTPARSDFSIVEKTGFEDTTLEITNNSGTNDLVIAVSMTMQALYLSQDDIKDVDVTTTPPEDGQALVYDVADGKFKPGASGDASFKLQSVSDPNATIKGGFILLGDGRELATYDGAGSASTDYGKDITINLDTILGTDPTNATTYYLYIDLNSLSSEVTLSDNGRKVYGVVEANFHLSTIAPELKDQVRYVPVGFIRSATSGTVWSGAGAAFGTLATRAHQKYASRAQRNYLDSWFDGSKTIESVTSGLTATGNITPSTRWKASNTSLLTIANQTGSALRETKSLKLDHIAVGAAFVQAPEFTLDTVDLGKPVTVSFDHGAVTAADDYQVYMVRYNSSGVYQESIPIFGTASATSPNSAQIPSGSVGTFQGFFIAGSTATDLYALRFYRNSGSDGTDILIDTLYVGPQSVVQGAAITDWVSYTPTDALSRMGSSVYTMKGWWRRVGDSMNVVGVMDVTSVSGAVNNNFAMSIPSGYSVDESKWEVSGNDGKDILPGYAYWFDAGATNEQMPLIPVFSTGSNNSVFFGKSAGAVDFIDGTEFGAGDAISFNITVPIVGWSSNVAMANRAVEEYASHNGSSIVLGLAGAAIPTSTPAGTKDEYDITSAFQNIQPTDRFFAEIQRGAVGPWLGGSLEADRLRFDGTNYIGYDVIFNGTSVKLVRGKYRVGTSTAWSGVVANTAWRVGRVKSGASVGYPVSARNVVGNTSGTAVPSGFIGEKISASLSNTSLSSGTDTTVTGTLALPPGVWLILAQGYFDGTGSTTWNNISILSISTTLATHDFTSHDQRSPTSLQDHTLACHKLVNISANTNYYMIASANFGASTAQILASRSIFEAVRIA
jgi:hypothetical protein